MGGHIIKMFLITVIVSLCIFSATSAQSCAGAGASCRDATFAETCQCPTGTLCSPNTPFTGAFFCQYTFCLPDSMFCDGNIGVCCSGKCEQLAGATYKTCTAVTTTTTTTTTTSTTTVTTTTTTVTTTTTQAPIQIIIATTTTTTAAPSSTVCTTTAGAACVFPFTYMGTTYTSCTNAGGFQTPWCSTKTDQYGNHIIGNFGDCNANTCAAAATTPAPTCSTPCKFPFKYNGVIHYACTNAGGFKNPWCSTKTDIFGRHVIGNYADCGVGCPVEILG